MRLMRPFAAALCLLAGTALAHPVTVESCGRSLNFDAAPERAVVHDVNMAEIMFALALQPRIVGVTGITGWYKTTPAFDAARGDIPELAAKNPSLENILSADPDFLFAGWHYGMQPGGEVTPDTLASFAVPVYELTESCIHIDKTRAEVSMETLYGDVRAIAAIFGVPDRAESLIAGWEVRIAAARRDTPQPLRVFLYGSGDDQPFTAGRYAMPTALIEAAGGRNVMDDIAMSWGRVGWEAVGERDPEVIIVLDYGEDGGAGLIAFLQAHPVMSTVTAVREGRFLPLKYSEITPGPANIGAVETLAAALAGGAILSVAAGAAGAVTGGDDGRFVHVAPDGATATLAAHPGAWVDCVVAHPSGLRACSVGRIAHLWRPGGAKPDLLEHPSTVGGLAFDPRGRRLAAAHYGGATVWQAAARRWKPVRLTWKGSHVGASFSPDGKYVVTAMQEDALHGWRLRDKADMAMSGYPARVKSFAWVGDAPWLATSGAESAVCWPFDGKDGPMGRPPEETCFAAKRLCSAVAGLPGETIVIAGLRDGAVLAGRIGDEGDAVVKGSGGAGVTALALTREGWLFIGCEDGLSLWLRLGGCQVG